MNIYLWQLLEASCGKYATKIKEWLEDFYYESKLVNIGWFIKNLPVIIKANISLFIFFNKNKCYFDWDYDYLYCLIIWKLKQIRDNMKGETVAGIESTKGFISTEVQSAIDCFEIFLDASIMSDERDELAWVSDSFKDPDIESDYVKKLYQVEEDCWEDFHDILKKRARYWWT